MEEKIDKLFGLFNDYKNQQLFSLCISQILSVYNDYPACLYQILKHTNKLIYSKSPDPRLRLDHRQIAAGIIERTYQLYCQKFESFFFQDFDCSIPSNLFHFETSIEDLAPMDEELYNIHDYEMIKQSINLHWSQIDYETLIKDDFIILGKDDKYVKRSLEKNKNPQDIDAHLSKQEQIKKEEDELLERMGISHNFNEANLSRIVQFLKGETYLPFEDGQSSSDNNHSESDSDNDLMGNYREKKGSKKKLQKQVESSDQKKVRAKDPQIKSFFIINPFNVIYNRALYELLSQKWEHRHASALILKSLIKQQGFKYLNFKSKLDSQSNISDNQLGQTIKDQLKVFASQTLLKQVQTLLTRCLVVLAMDRFADYMSDQTHMLVREAACSISIQLLTLEHFTHLWNSNKEELTQFIKLLKQFVLTSRQSRTYEVSQSALFLINGLLNKSDEKELIIDLFADLVLDIADDDIVDEVLILLSDIWGQLLIYRQHDTFFIQKYFDQVLPKIFKQIRAQEDISYGSKHIFEFLTLLVSNKSFSLEQYNNPQKTFEQFDLIKKYFFHRTESVRKAFYEYLLKYTEQLNQKIITPPMKKEYITQLHKFAQVTYQHSLLEKNESVFKNLSQIFCQLIFLIIQYSGNDGQEQINELLKKVDKIALSIGSFKQADKQNYLNIICNQFAVFEGFFLKQYDILALDHQMTILEFQQYRIVKTALIYHSWYKSGQSASYINNYRILSNLNFSQAQLIWFLNDSFSQISLTEVTDYLNQVNESSIQGDIFQTVEDDIISNMLIINSILDPYSKVEKDKEVVSVISIFLELFRKMQVNDKRLRRQLYNEIFENLKQLNSLDFELSGAEIQKLQNGTVALVESISRFNKIAQDLIQNLVCLYANISLQKSKPVYTPKLMDILVQRIKNDKLDVFQNIAAENLQRYISSVFDIKIVQQILTQIFERKNQNPARVIYLFGGTGILKRKDYGKKQLLLNLIQDEKIFQKNISEIINQLFFSELCNLFSIPTLSKEKTNPGQYENVTLFHLSHFYQKTINLTQALWGGKMLARIYAYLYQKNLKCTFYHDFIGQLFSQIFRLISLLSSDNQTLYNNDTLIIYSITFSKSTCSKLIIKLLTTQVQLLYEGLSSNNQLNQSFLKQCELSISSILLLIKKDVLCIYDILSLCIEAKINEFTSISPLLILPVIKKLTTVPQATRLLGLLVPMIAVSCYHNQLSQLGFKKLEKKMTKGIKFIEGFGKMRQVEYDISQCGLKDPSILRDYQCEGIRWLGFLVQHNLNAALCDDMGLGKTIQTLIVIASEIAKSKSQTVSLIVAPSTVVDHWMAEIKKYFHPNILKPALLNSDQALKQKCNVYLASYNQLLKLATPLAEKDFFFLVLDEAHILKNSRNKSSKVIKSLKARHKVVLSGTPVQNHLLELWSLFDILFPNYLGDEEYFKKHFAKAFHTNLFSLNNEELLFDEQQTKTLKQLHKKVLPFIMRRTKQDVLPQLPAKIIEDYRCPLVPPLQTKLYELLDKNSFSEDFSKKIEAAQGEQKTRMCESVLKLLQLIRQVLDHPFLIKQNYKEEKPKKKIKSEPQDIESLTSRQINEVFSTVSDPQNYTHSGKMVGLKDILQQLGFGSGEESEQIQIMTNHNKVLIFSRFRNALKMIAEQLLKTQFPQLKYLILDGSVAQNQRYPLVTKFNEDPEVRVLLLTTQVGGLGLNLSSANIVIMFDHDYNPVNDQQAIDRAHRIGQKNVVQVFRLIVSDTLEEKIMGIQRFKQAISRAIVNSDNASLIKMEKSDLLSLLEQSEGNKGKQEKDKTQDTMEKLSGPYSSILKQVKLDLLEQMNFNKEY